MIWAVFLLVVFATPAQADPAGLVISGLASAGIAVSPIGAALIRLGVGVALTAVARAGQQRGPKDPGIRTENPTSGGVRSQSFILGRYRTAGNLVAPLMSHDWDGDTPNAYRVQILDVSDLPVTGLHSVYVDDTEISAADFTPDNTEHNIGKINTGTVERFDDHLWMNFYDGTQTAADNLVRNKYFDQDFRPWLADMVGTGVAYATMMFRYNREVYQTEPRVSFVVDGVKLYDPRADSTVGGTGSQRWNDSATWAFTENPVVMIYNIMRGITIDSDTVWGVRAAADELPVDVWSAAMNDADARGFTAGYEVLIAEDEPFDIVQELLKACDGDIADMGGEILIHVGPPALPIKLITDDDILADYPQTQDPFPALPDLHNAVQVTYVDPDLKWQPREAPIREDATAIAEDGRKLTAAINLGAVTNKTQAQRLGQAWLADARRLRRHTIVLGPEALTLRVFDVIGWDSDRNGYIGKTFEIAEMAIAPDTLSVTLSLRERVPSDYDWQPGDEIATTAPSANIIYPAPQTVPNFALSAAVIRDGAGDRRPALRMTWSGDLRDARGIQYIVRVAATGDVVARGTYAAVTENEMILSEGILPNVQYEAKARLRLNRPTVSTAWVSATTGNIRLNTIDLTERSVINFDDAASTTNQILTSTYAGYLLYDAEIESGHRAIVQGSAFINPFSVSEPQVYLGLRILRDDIPIHERIWLSEGNGYLDEPIWFFADNAATAGTRRYKIQFKNFNAATGNYRLVGGYMRTEQTKR